MQNRKNLHDYGLVLAIIGILHLFMFVATVISGLVDGSVAATINSLDPSMQVAVKAVLGVLGGIMGLLVFADVLIGLKALKVSEKPNADKGHITAAKVFFVLSVLSAISNAINLFAGSAVVIDAVLNLASAALGAVVYVYFIQAAVAVRNDVINGAK